MGKYQVLCWVLAPFAVIAWYRVALWGYRRGYWWRPRPKPVDPPVEDNQGQVAEGEAWRSGY